MLVLQRTSAQPGLTKRPTQLGPRLSILVLGALPALGLLTFDWQVPPVVALLIFGAAVVCAAFGLAWAGEAAEAKISGGLAIAGIALVAVLPEMAVDVFYSFSAAARPELAEYIGANMTGSNRLMLGLGWPLIVLLGLAVQRGLRTGPAGRAQRRVLRLEGALRLELGFLLVAGIAGFLIPLTGKLHVVLGVALLGWFAFFLVRVSKMEVEEAPLLGVAATIAALPQRSYRLVIGLMIGLAAGLIVLCAEPFATALVNTGTDLGIDEFLVVQWLAPLASEAPEFIIAALLARHGRASAGLRLLITAQVAQWTVLLGALPIAHLIGGGGWAISFADRQLLEFTLTSALVVLGVALVSGMRIRLALAGAIFGLYVLQLVVLATQPRTTLTWLVLGAGLAVVALRRTQVFQLLRLGRE